MRLLDEADGHDKKAHEHRASSGMEQKYGDLTRRYTDLVHKFEALVHERVDSHYLAAWAMRTSSSALCAIRQHAVILTNARFDELTNAQPPRRLRPIGEAIKPEPLRVLVANDSWLLSESDRAVVQRRYREVGRDAWYDARFERLGPELIMCMVVDVTAEVRNDRELERARAAMGQRERLRDVGEIAAGVAHDLNNTFNALNLRLDLMGRRGTRDELENDLAIVKRMVSDAVARVARLQDFARPSGDVEEVELAEIAEAAVETMRPQLTQRKHAVNVTVEVPPKLAIRGVAADLRHILVNLILNARDAMPRGGTIHIAASRRNGDIVCTVSDEGRGIKDNVMPRIFEPFFTTKGKKGTGLGLSVVRDILARMGASISAANGSQGGAVFTMTFPTGVRVEPRRAAAVPALPAGGRVLLVGDEPEQLEGARKVLEMEGHDVVVSGSGEDPAAGPFDLVVLNGRREGELALDALQALMTRPRYR